MVIIMISDFKNLEGYDDPTAFTAIQNIINRQKIKNRNIVYVCSPLSGNIQANINKAIEYCKFINTKGYIPIAVHLLFSRFLDDGNPAERKRAIDMGLEILSRCDELWSFGKKISDGMAIELKFAQRYQIKIKRFTSCCKTISQKEVRV